MGVFSDLRILDGSTGIAGAYCTKLLRDAGAEVLKVEPPGGDPLRRWTSSGAPLAADEDGALFRFLAAGKSSVTLDLARNHDRSTFLEYVAEADLVIESVATLPGSSPPLDFGELRAANPGICLLSISPWGLDGPWAKRPANEWTLQAAAGITARRGLPQRGPVGVGGRIGDWIAGTYASFGAIVALLDARASGAGRHVDLSTFEALLQCATQYHDMNGQFFDHPLPQLLDTPSIEPARDGWVGFATVTAQQWSDFCALIGCPELAEDPKYHHTDNRMKDLPFIHEKIHAWTREHDVAEIVELASAMRIPVAPVGNGAGVTGIDHFVARGVFEKHPDGFLQPRSPYRLDTFERARPAPAPRPGEHRSPVFPPRTPPSSSPAPSFAGLRVLDLTAFWAGPFMTSHLALLGADVIKVESTQRPDGMRMVNAIRGGRFWEAGSIFHGANAGKRDLTLALDRKEGREIFERLATEADVLVENFSVRVLDNLGIDLDALRRRNPGLIVVRMPSWGLDGPWKDRVGFAMNVEQACGLAWLSGYPDLPMIVNVCDPIGALHAFVALTRALEYRQESGVGSLIEVPLVEPGLNLAAEQIVEGSAYGRALERLGNRSAEAAPQGVYPCADGQWIALSVTAQEQWDALTLLLGQPDLVGLDAAGRRNDHDRIDAALGRLLAGEPAESLAERLREMGIAAETLVNAHRVMPNPQLAHRHFYQELEHDVVGRRRYPTLPFRVDGGPMRLHRTPPPTLGQHNEEILAGELGMDPEEIERLRAAGIIGEKPAWR